MFYSNDIPSKRWASFIHTVLMKLSLRTRISISEADAQKVARYIKRTENYLLSEDEEGSSALDYEFRRGIRLTESQQKYQDSFTRFNDHEHRLNKVIDEINAKRDGNFRNDLEIACERAGLSRFLRAVRRSYRD